MQTPPFKKKKKLLWVGMCGGENNLQDKILTMEPPI